jgi:hypothetical protein
MISRWILGGAALALLWGGAAQAQHKVTINPQCNAANPDSQHAKLKHTVNWNRGGQPWTVKFQGHSPCQNGKMQFSSSESASDRQCRIAVTCAEDGHSSCRYKYDLSCPGNPGPADPEIIVDGDTPPPIKPAKKAAPEKKR